MACCWRLWVFLWASLCLLPMAVGADRYELREESDGRVVCASRYGAGKEDVANVGGVQFCLEDVPALRLQALMVQLRGDYRRPVPDYNHLAVYVLDEAGTVLAKSRDVAQQGAKVTFRFADKPVEVQKGKRYFVYFIKGLQRKENQAYWESLALGRRVERVESGEWLGHPGEIRGFRSGNYLRLKVIMGKDRRTARQWGMLMASPKVGEPVPFPDALPLMQLELVKPEQTPSSGKAAPAPVRTAPSQPVVRMPGAETLMLQRLERQLAAAPIKEAQERAFYQEHGWGALRKVTEGGDINALAGTPSRMATALSHLVALYGSHLRSARSPEGLWYLLLHGARVGHGEGGSQDASGDGQAGGGRGRASLERLLEVCRELEGSPHAEKALPLEAERQRLLAEMMPDWGRAFFDPATGIPFEELKKRLVETPQAVPHQELTVFSPVQGRLFRVAGRACVRGKEGSPPPGRPETPPCMAPPLMEQGEVLARSADDLTLRWESGATERYVRQVDGRYYREDISAVEPESAPYAERIRELLGSQSVRLYHEKVTLVRPEGRREYRVSGSMAKDTRSGREARVVGRDVASLTLQWGSGEPETYHLQQDGAYARREEGGLPPVEDWRQVLAQEPDSLAHEELVLVSPASYSLLWLAGRVAYWPGMNRPWADVMAKAGEGVVLRCADGSCQVYVKQKGDKTAPYVAAVCSETTWRAPRADKGWKQYGAEVKRMLRDNPGMAPHETLDFWVEWEGRPTVAELWVYGGVAYLPPSGEAAEIVEWDRRHLTLEWEDGQQVRYARQGDGAYGAAIRKRVSQAEHPRSALQKLKARLRQSPEKIPYTQVRLVHPDWPYGSAVFRFYGEAGCRPDGREGKLATVYQDGDQLCVRWDLGGDEVYQKRPDGMYYLWDFRSFSTLSTGDGRGNARYGVTRRPGKRLYWTDLGEAVSRKQASSKPALRKVAAGGVAIRLSGERPMTLESMQVELGSEACRKAYGKVGAYVLDANGTVLDMTDKVEWNGAKLRFLFDARRAVLQPNLSYTVYFAKGIQAGDVFSKLRVGSRVAAPDSSVSGFLEQAKGNHLLLAAKAGMDPYTASAWGLLAPSRQRGETFCRYAAPVMEVDVVCEEEEGEPLKRQAPLSGRMSFELLRVQHPAWHWAGESRTAELYVAGTEARLVGSRRVAEILLQQGERLVVYWPQEDATEVYRAREKGIYWIEREAQGRVALSMPALPESRKNEVSWRPGTVPEGMLRLHDPRGTSHQWVAFYWSGKAGCLASNQGVAEVLAREDGKLVLYWFGNKVSELFVKQKDGVYRLEKRMQGRNAEALLQAAAAASSPSRDETPKPSPGKPAPAPQGERPAEPHETLALVDPGWGADQLEVMGKVARRASAPQETATVERQDDRLELVWEGKKGTEVYRRLDDGRYYRWDASPGQAEGQEAREGVPRCQQGEKEGKLVVRTAATGVECAVAAGGVSFQLPRGGVPGELESLSVRVWKESLREVADYKRLGVYVLDEQGRLLDKTRQVEWEGDQVRFVFSNRAARLKPGKAYAAYFVKGINSIYADDYYSRLKAGMVVEEPESSVSGFLEKAKGNHLLLRVVEEGDPGTAAEWGLLEPSRQRGALVFRFHTPLMEVAARPLPEEGDDEEEEGEPLWLYVGLPLAGLAGAGLFLWFRWRWARRVKKSAGW